MASKTHSTQDYLSHILVKSSTLLFISFVFILFFSLIWNSKESIQKYGLSFITKSEWNIKFLELTNIRMKDSNSLTLYFSVPLKDQDINKSIIITYQERPISYIYNITNLTLNITPTQLLEGEYQILISSSLTDIYDNKIEQETLWAGYIVPIENNIQNPKIINAITGELKKNITNENYRHFYILPFIVGTIFSSLIALLIAFPVALSIAILFTEYSNPKSNIMKIFIILIDLLAGIPSVIYGLWGLSFLVPILGANLFTASLVLAIMIMPYATSLSREAIALVPNKIKQAGLGLGSTKFKVIRYIVLPYAKSGIIAGVLLTLGRALGETLAVTMVIGNRNQMPTSLFAPAQTIASLIANEYGEASGLKQSALIESGVILIIITLLFSLLGRFIIKHSNRDPKG